MFQIFDIYLFVGKNIKNWYGLKSRFVWFFFLRDSETLPQMPVGLRALLHCRENDIFLHLSETFIDWSMFIYCKIVERSSGSNSLLKKKRKKIPSFWIQSTFPSYQIITCPVCLDTLCNWTTKTFKPAEIDIIFQLFAQASVWCTDLDLIWICNL